VTLRRLNCVKCHNMLLWDPDLIKGTMPGYVLRCCDHECESYNKIQDYITLDDLLKPGENPLGHLEFFIPEEDEAMPETEKPV
jgi:hypothetical protein